MGSEERVVNSERRSEDFFKNGFRVSFSHFFLFELLFFLRETIKIYPDFYPPLKKGDTGGFSPYFSQEPIKQNRDREQIPLDPPFLKGEKFISINVVLSQIFEFQR